MTKLKKGLIILTAVIMAVCLFTAVWILLPEPQTAHGVTYTISSDDGDKVAGTTHLTTEGGRLTVDTSTGVITKFSAPDGPFYLIIPEKVGTTTVKGVNSEVFKGTQILSLSFENPTTRVAFTIGDGSSSDNYPGTGAAGAFSQCTLLQEVVLPKNITQIGKNAFLGCTNLKEITIPDTVNEIGSGAFAYCTALKDVKNLEGSNVTTINNGTFYGCSALAHIDTGKITTVSRCAFTNCKRLTRLDLHLVKTMYAGARNDNNDVCTFDGCSNLVEVYINTHFDHYYYTSGLEQISNGVTGYYTIGNYTDRSLGNASRCGGLLRNLFNLYFYEDSTGKTYGQSWYHETSEGYVFVKNAQSVTNTSGGLGDPWCPTTTVLATSSDLGNKDAAHTYRTSVMHDWTIYYEQNQWYLVAYNGDGGYNNDVPMEFPKSFTAPNGDEINRYDVVEGLFNIAHAHNVKISSAVRAIGNRAFRGSSCQVMDMSEAKNLTYVGAGYLDLVSSPIVYLPTRESNTSKRTIGSPDSLNNDVDVPVHIGRHYGNDYSIPSMVIMPTYKSYQMITAPTGTGYAHSWSYYGTFTDVMTYVIDVNLHYESAPENNEVVEKRLYGKNYNYVQNSNGTWSIDSSLNLPKQKGYKNSVWYREPTYENEVGDVSEINSQLNMFGQEDINLYAKSVKKFNYDSETGKTIAVKPQDANNEITVNSFEYSADITYRLNYQGLRALLNKDETGYFPADETFAARIENFYAANSNDLTVDKIYSVHSAGTYRIKVQLDPAYGEWSEPIYINVTVDRKAIDLTKDTTSINNYLSFKLHEGNELESTSVYINPEDGKAYRDKVTGYEEYENRINSVANSAGEGEARILELSRFYLDTERAVYNAQYDNQSGESAGKYTTTITLNINDGHDNNYYFKTSDDNYDDNAAEHSRGLTVEFTSRSSIRITKVWFIVTANNWFTKGTNNQTYGVSGWEFKNFNNEVTAPSVRFGNPQAIEFTLKTDNSNLSEQEQDLTGVRKPISVFETYVNQSMPVGEYTITFFAEAATDDRNTATQPFSTSYRFTVSNADIADVAEELIDKFTQEENTEYRFRLPYNASGVQPYDSTTKDVLDSFIEQGDSIWYSREGIWSESRFDKCYRYVHSEDSYENFTITYNTGNMDVSDYISNISSSLNKEGLYTVYYQLSAKNYDNLVNVNDESERRNRSYTVAIYTTVEAPTFNNPLYTGGRVVPEFGKNSIYTVYYDSTSTDTYITGGDEAPHYVYFAINNPTLYSWLIPEGYNRTYEYLEANTVLKVKFNISSTANSWSRTPTITSWVYGETPNAPVAGTKYGTTSEITYSYYLAKLVDGKPQGTNEGGFEKVGGKLAVDSETGLLKNADAGIYILHADTADTGSYSGISYEITFEILKITNGWEKTPSVITWQWNGYDKFTNLFTAVPNHALPKYGENRAEAVLWTVWEKVGTKVTEFRLVYDEAHALWVVPDDVAVKFNELVSGTYYIEFAVENSTNFTEITNADSKNWISFVISEAVDTWTTTSSVVAWQYGSYNNGTSILAAQAGIAGANVHYSVYTSYNKETKEGTFAADALRDFTLDADSKVSDTVLGALNALEGNKSYTLRVWTAGERGKYKALDADTTFRVAEAENDWVVFPSIRPWVLGAWFEENTPVGKAKFGNVHFVIKNSKGVTVLTAEYDAETEKTTIDNAGKAFVEKIDTELAGIYTLTATVDGVSGKYTGLPKAGSAESVVFEIYLSSDDIKPNGWAEVPSIESWTAGDTANVIDLGSPDRGKNNITVVYEMRYYDEENHVNTWKSLGSEAPESVIGSYRARVEVFEKGHRDYMSIDVYFEIFARSNYWVSIPAIGDWELSQEAPVPSATAYVDGTTYEFFYKLANQYDAEQKNWKDGAPSEAGEYVLIVIAKADYCNDLQSEVKFNVKLSKNDWKNLPTIEGWSEEFSHLDHLPFGEAEHGKIVYTWFTADGKPLPEKPTEEGTYIMHSTATAPGYETLEADYEFTIEPAFDQTLLIIDGVLGLIACVATIIAISVVVKKKKDF